MAVREFDGPDGTPWRTWEIKPESIHPITRAEDYLSDCFTTGWLVFETRSGDEKRRLCPYPTRWLRASDNQLRQLLDIAEAVPTRKLEVERRVADPSSTGKPVTVPPEDDKLDITDIPVVRSFKYPGGRLWSVCVIEHPEDGGKPALRFTAGSRFFDMRPWPKDWVDVPDAGLIEMLRAAAPRPPTTPPPGVSRRRFNDPPISRSV
jgi:hypothetical protein